MSSPYLDLQGNPISQETVIGCGGSALVLLQNDVAIKIPLRFIWSSELDMERNIESLQHEQKIYRRLQSSTVADKRSEGIIRCLKTSDHTTELTFMANGDLRSYITPSPSEHERPSRQTQLIWSRDLARTFSFIHDRRILVTDIASRNFLLDTDLSIKFCDFSEASLLPLESDMSRVDDNGFTTQIDVGLLGAVIYEIITETKCDIELFKDNARYDGRAYWPERSSLPSTDDLWLGTIIERCWDGTFRSADDSLLQALDSQIASSPNTSKASVSSLFYNSPEPQFVMTVVCGLGLVALLLYKPWSLR